MHVALGKLTLALLRYVLDECILVLEDAGVYSLHLF